MKIYIATKWENRQRAIDLAAILEARGYEITVKWWEHEAYAGPNPESAEEVNEAANTAVRDIEGVRAADAVVAIMEDDLPYRGAWAEFGAALALGKTVYVLGTYHTKAVFGYHPLVQSMRWPV